MRLLQRHSCSRSARGARADLHAPKAPKSKAEMEAEAAAERLMAKHREVRKCVKRERKVTHNYLIGQFLKDRPKKTEKIPGDDVIHDRLGDAMLGC